MLEKQETQGSNNLRSEKGKQIQEKIDMVSIKCRQ